MPYAVFVGVALIIHILINFDIFDKKNDFPAIKSYRLFIVSIIVYYLVDMMWGVFEASKNATALYIDTFIYFIMMGAIILAWTAFVVRYLSRGGWLSRIVQLIGIIYFVVEIALLIVNFFYPVLFSVDENAAYLTYAGRNAMLGVQLILFVLMSIYSLVVTIRIHKLSTRYLIVSLSCIALAVAIGLQFYYPYMPVYSVGLLTSICLLNTYTIKDRNEIVKRELDNANILAYTDSLTGVHSRHAYVEMEVRIDKEIANHEAKEFAVAVFDLNGLKHINDTLGHKAGDQYIIDACALIKKHFGECCDLYRFGGDEFTLILKEECYKKRLILMKEFNNEVESNINENKPVVSCGMSDYRPEEDNTFRAVFSRADKLMYERKVSLKKLQ